MQSLLASDKGARSSEAQLNFALGKAFEQRQLYPQAFAALRHGNARRRLDAPFDIENFERRSARIRAFFDSAFFAARAGSWGPERRADLHRRPAALRSTLVEQILASHSCVEGTMELPNIINITREFRRPVRDRDGYPESVSSASAVQLSALGSRYLEENPRRYGGDVSASPTSCPIISVTSDSSTRSCRTRPSSTHVAIRWIAASAPSSSTSRRADLQLRPRHLGRYYRCYLSLMDHWDAVLPGKVLHLQYEELGARPGGEHPPPPRALPAALPRPPASPFTRRNARCAPPAPKQVRPAALYLGSGLLAAFRHRARALASCPRRQSRALPG